MGSKILDTSQIPGLCYLPQNLITMAQQYCKPDLNATLAEYAWFIVLEYKFNYLVFNNK